jgi:UDP-N-acetylglucosamine--N-acetylmuramyl-(pentapeptide) pyrophosphoryl-undecaprenol N-acetylglucosamine transferase
MKKLRIIIAGGGTGGHIFPAVAIGHALMREHADMQLLFVGANGKMEMEKVPLEGFKIVGLDIAGFNRTQMLKNLSLPIKLIKSRIQAKKILKEFRPHAVVGVGGYASFPILYAAQSMGIPTLIQEQNSYAGKSNTILAKKAAAICVAYPGMDRFFPKDKIVITGNPVRKNIADMRISSAAGKEHFGLDSRRKTLFVTGGSQGARSVNEAILANLSALMAEGIQILWQTGKPFFEQAKHAVTSFGSDIKVAEFIKEMDYAYAAADCVVARAGALAIAELCIAGKPVIFVPYPHAAEDHQTANAVSLQQAGAAWVVTDADAKTVLGKKLVELLNNTAAQQHMGEQLKSMAISDADNRIADKIIAIAGKQ